MGGYILKSFHIAPVHDSKLNSPDPHQLHTIYRTDCSYSEKEKKGQRCYPQPQGCHQKRIQPCQGTSNQTKGKCPDD